MNKDMWKFIRSSEKYKYVSLQLNKNGQQVWVASVAIGKKSFGHFFDDERSAGLYVDKILISKGKEPVNILKRI